MCELLTAAQDLGRASVSYAKAHSQCPPLHNRKDSDSLERVRREEPPAGSSGGGHLTDMRALLVPAP